MRLVVQRVRSAVVEIDQNIHSQIKEGLMLLIGIESGDSEVDAHYLAMKCASMRLFEDNNGKMNLSLKEVAGEVLIVSQFTLHASTKKGNRPSFIKAARPEKAIPLYEYFIKQMESTLQHKVQTGKFGANMQITLINEGPVTILLDSKNKE
tara:strand:+ start:46 stop:498 length:453 start_codon:yes stop_codon:yes gene_type:complete